MAEGESGPDDFAVAHDSLVAVHKDRSAVAKAVACFYQGLEDRFQPTEKSQERTASPTEAATTPELIWPPGRACDALFFDWR